MRIIDCEAHVVLAAGVEQLYAMRDGTFTTTGDAEKVAAEAIAAGEFDLFVDDVIAEMDEYGVDQTLIMRGSTPAPNSIFAQLVRQHPDRFVGFAAWGPDEPTGSPLVESPGALRSLDEGLSLPELRGVGEVSLRRFFPSLSPEQACAAFVPTMDVCRKYRKPIMFHTGSDGPASQHAYRDPARLEPLAAEFPEVPIILAHMGGRDEQQFAQAVQLAKVYRNVYMSTSKSCTDFVERAVRAVGAERLIFGTDWSPAQRFIANAQGINAHAAALEIVQRAAIDDAEKRLILGENLAELLAI